MKKLKQKKLSKQQGRKRPKAMMIIGIMVAVYIIISLIVGLDLFFFSELPAGFKELFERYFPPKFEHVASFSSIREGIWETLLISAAATFVGATLALIVTLMAINDMKFNIFGYISKVTSAIARNIPAYIWGLILIYVLWYGAYVAYIALTITTFGFLVRAFNEVVNNTGKSSIEALKATGATNWQIIMRAIVPGSMPLLFSWSLYSFEVNVRGATIVALVTRTGLGGLLSAAGDLSIRPFPDKYNYQMAIILGIALMVIVIDVFVTRVRARLLRWS